MDKNSFETLRLRMGDRYFGQRMRMQALQVAVKLSGSKTRFYWENVKALPRALNILLHASGMLGRAQLNALQFAVEESDVYLDKLPAAFDGYRILQLSDLHIDKMLDDGERLATLVQTLDYDLCVMTGDFRFHTSGPFDKVLLNMQVLMRSIHANDGVLGILGNHDYLEQVPGLEALGIRFLLNESISIQRDAERLWIAGVDDPHYYELHDLPRALSAVKEQQPVILLAHSPEMLEEAQKSGIAYYLCGHTHGGQVCLPGGTPLITNARCQRQYVAGRWQYFGMPGYTSRGTGSSSLPVRLNCQPEVTLHTLHCAQE